MHALDLLADPVRRRILELLAQGERTSGSVVEVIAREFEISQPAVSQHLRVLRENGFVSVRSEGPRRLYSVQPEPLQQADAWLSQFRGFWERRLGALGSERARGKRRRAP
jgi:DNA-binding transcriptional ArsR family regulator